MEFKPVKLILLDFDGTLVDTRRANAQAYVATFREAGYPLTEEEYLEKYFGLRCHEFLTRYGITSYEVRERLRLRKIELYPQFFESVRLNEPLWQFCTQFRQMGGKVWIVSTGSRQNIDNVCAYLGIRIAEPEDTHSDRIDGIFSGHDSSESKPSPECFLKVMEMEGATPQETLIFEDSQVGLEAAQRSGASFFRVDMNKF